MSMMTYLFFSFTSVGIGVGVSVVGCSATDGSEYSWHEAWRHTAAAQRAALMLRTTVSTLSTAAALTVHLIVEYHILDKQHTTFKNTLQERIKKNNSNNLGFKCTVDSQPSTVISGSVILDKKARIMMASLCPPARWWASSH